MYDASGTNPRNVYPEVTSVNINPSISGISPYSSAYDMTIMDPTLDDELMLRPDLLDYLYPGLDSNGDYGADILDVFYAAIVARMKSDEADIIKYVLDPCSIKNDFSHKLENHNSTGYMILYQNSGNGLPFESMINTGFVGSSEINKINNFAISSIDSIIAYISCLKEDETCIIDGHNGIISKGSMIHPLSYLELKAIRDSLGEDHFYSRNVPLCGTRIANAQDAAMAAGYKSESEKIEDYDGLYVIAASQSPDGKNNYCGPLIVYGPDGPVLGAEMIMPCYNDELPQDMRVDVPVLRVSRYSSGKLEEFKDYPLSDFFIKESVDEQSIRSYV